VPAQAAAMIGEPLVNIAGMLLYERLVAAGADIQVVFFHKITPRIPLSSDRGGIGLTAFVLP